MQVSWIEPDELRALASKLLEPQKSDASPTMWELHTLPDFSPAMPGGMFDSVRDLSAPIPAEAMPPQAPALGHDIASIREKLRAIRDRAQDAGLLPPPAPAPLQVPVTAQVSPFSPAPEPAPAPAPVAEVAPAPAPEPAHATVEAAVQPSAAVTSFLPLEGTIAERLDAFSNWAIQITNAQELILVDDHGDSLWGAPSRNDLVVSAMLALSTSLRSSASEFSSISAVVRSKAGPDHDVAIMPCSTHYGMVTLAIVSKEIVNDEVVACLREALIQTIDGARVP